MCVWWGFCTRRRRCRELRKRDLNNQYPNDRIMQDCCALLWVIPKRTTSPTVQSASTPYGITCRMFLLSFENIRTPDSREVDTFFEATSVEEFTQTYVHTMNVYQDLVYLNILRYNLYKLGQTLLVNCVIGHSFSLTCMLIALKYGIGLPVFAVIRMYLNGQWKFVNFCEWTICHEFHIALCPPTIVQYAL